MPQTVTDTVKIWSAPALLVVVLSLAGYIWIGQQSEIASLRNEVVDNKNALLVVTANQTTSKEDRQAFQEATTRRLDQMTDLLATLNDAVVRLTTLQEQNDAGR